MIGMRGYGFGGFGFGVGGLTEPALANAGAAFSVRIAGAIYAAFLTNSRRVVFWCLSLLGTAFS
jgi:hypothetical protein